MDAIPFHHQHWKCSSYFFTIYQFVSALDFKVDINCFTGSYCDTDELSTVSGQCQAGHYCTNGSIEIAPVGKEYGDICPVGNYCPTGSSAPIPCDAGIVLIQDMKVF